MQPELALKAISYAIIAISFLAILSVLLVSLKKEISRGIALRGVMNLCLAVIGIFALVALGAIYFHARKIVRPYTVSQHLGTAAVSRSSR